MTRDDRGGEDEARQRLIDAARRSGLSVGDLVRALAEPRRDEPRNEPARSIDDLADRLRRLALPGEPGRAPSRDRGATRERDATLDEIAATVGRLTGPDEARRRPLAGRRDEESHRILDALEGLDRRVRALTDEAPMRRGQRAADVEPPRPPSRPAADRPAAAMDAAFGAVTPDDLDRRFRELGEKIDRLRIREDVDPTAPILDELRALRDRVEAHGGTQSDLADEIGRVGARLETLIELRPDHAAIAPLADEVARLRDAVTNSDVEASLRSLEAGYSHVVDRLDELRNGLAGPRVEPQIDREIAEIRSLLGELPRIERIADLEGRLDGFGARLEAVLRQDGATVAETVDRRLTELRGEIGALDPNAVVRALDERLAVFSQRLEDIERAARGPVAPERLLGLFDELRTIAAGNRTIDEIHRLEDRLVGLADRLDELDRRTAAASAGDGRLEAVIADIAARLDALSAPRQPDPAVAALEKAVERLDDMLLRAPEAARAAALDRDERATADVELLTREIAAMRREMDESRSSDDLEAQIRLLAERLDHSAGRSDDDGTLGQIEDQLAVISRQLAQAEVRFQDVGAIEGHIVGLTHRIEEHHAQSIEAARDAAREAVRDLAGDGGGLSDTVLRALQEDLRSLQSAARDTESRTNDTLISLHDALSGIVGRLTAIEKIAQGSARSAAAARQAAESAVASRPTRRNEPTPPVAPPVVEPIEPPVEAAPAVEIPASATIAGRTPPAEALARAREMLAQAAAPSEDTRPLEPGSGKPSPFAAPIEPKFGAPIADASRIAARKADFIAAARRAAQAAAESEAADEHPGDEPPADDGDGGTEGEAHKNGRLARIGSAIKNRRRPLVLATAAVVLAVLTLQVMPNRDGTPIEVAGDTETTAGERPAEAAANATTANATTAGAAATAGSIPAEAARTAETATTTAPQNDASMLAKTPTAERSSGLSAPVAVLSPSDASGAATTTASAPPASPAAASAAGNQTVPASSATTSAQAPTSAQASASAPAAAPATPATTPRTAAADADKSAPAAASDGPATTGSIAPTTATDPSGPLPEKIGSEALRRAAIGGDAKAAFEVGLRFAEGRTVTPDPTKAALWYARAAEKGLPQAQYRLALAYEKGLGIPRDGERARTFYLAAAQQGNVRAMHNLGVLYANARDMAQAVPWFQKAADLGMKDSQFNLGVIHALGSGVKQDLAVSYKWFALAARQGDAEAEKKMNEIAGHLDRVNLAAARMAVQTWVQRTPDAAVNDETKLWSEPMSPAAAVPATTIGRDAVALVQQQLKSKGYYVGPIDGEQSAVTRAAIRAYQKKTGMAQTGEVDGGLMKALGGRQG